jgi:hypothetical protein
MAAGLLRQNALPAKRLTGIGEKRFAPARMRAPGGPNLTECIWTESIKSRRTTCNLLIENTLYSSVYFVTKLQNSLTGP